MTEAGEVVAGRNPVMEALKARRVRRLFISETVREDKTIKALLQRAHVAGVLPQTVPPHVLERHAMGSNHQGVVALCDPKEYYTLDEVLERARERNEDPFIILLDGVEDPHNLGAVLRVADGAGAHGVVIPNRGAAGLTPTVFKSSAGAAEHVPIVMVVNIMDALTQLKKNDVWIGVAEADQGKPYYEERLTGSLGLIMGSEGHGVARPLVKHADFAVHIPLLGQVTSLNVSVATAVLSFERARQIAVKNAGGGKKQTAP